MIDPAADTRAPDTRAPETSAPETSNWATSGHERVLNAATPCLVVDTTVLESNLQRMAAHARGLGVALRPHAKTHKTWQIAQRQLALGAAGLTVATVGEAEVFADAGCTDLFIAYPIWAAGSRGERLRALAQRCALRVGVDSAAGAQLLSGVLAGTGAEVVVEVDSGHHRTGVRSHQAGELAAAAARLGLSVAGVFTFPGHSYARGQQQRVAGDEARALCVAERAVRAAGIPAGTIRSGGSTPTASLPGGDSQGRCTALNELRPGVYAFNDAQQVELGVVDWESIALTAAGTVVSRSGRQVVLDSGSKVLGADRQSWATGYGRLPDHPRARITALSEHHATVTFPEDATIPDLGAVLRVAPNHVCAAVNLADELVVVADGTVVDRWQVVARGRNA